MNTASTRPTPRFLPPDPPDLSRALTRAAVAMVMREIRGPTDGSAEQILERMWPNDRSAPIVLRSATAPMSTATGSGAVLQPNITSAFVSGLQLRSAAAQLIGLGVQLSLQGIGQILIPHAITNAALAFVSEGSPIPMLQRSLTNSVLGPAKKIAGIGVLTRELAEGSAGNAETAIGVLLEEASALALDGAVLSATAATAVQPAGILAGVAPLTPTAGGGLTALTADIKALVAAVVAGGGGNSLLFVGNANEITSLKLSVPPAFDYPLVASPALAPGIIVCVDPGAFASAFTDTPQLETSHGATLHFEDANPLQIGTPGTPPTVAAPARNLFQTDSFGIRLILSGSWCMRQPAAVAWIQGATW